MVFEEIAMELQTVIEEKDPRWQQHLWLRLLGDLVDENEDFCKVRLIKNLWSRDVEI